MGSGPSHDGGQIRRLEEEVNRIQLNARRIEEENQRIQEENRRIQEENRKAQEESRENELRRTQETIKEMQRVQEENRKIQEENRRAQEESRENELRRTQETMKEMQRVQEENRRAQEESRENELRRTQETMKEMQRVQEENRKIQEENRRIQEEMRMEEERKIREEERKRMEELAKTIEREARIRVEKEIWLREEAERNLEQGIPPVKYPTGEEVKTARERHQYQDGSLHLAITGVSGSGKSSLVNAFRGLRDKNRDAAKTGISETTGEIGRYLDPERPWIFWYDVPGAGTLKIPDWQYFNNQGLYIFDIIIIAIDIRFTKIDVGLLFSCNRFGIPAFVVRSKADQHISNMMSDDRDDDDDSDCSDDNPENFRKRSALARSQFSTETRHEFESLLKTAGLPPQDIYIVSKSALVAFIKGSKPPPDVFDEVALMRDVIHAANGRRNQHS